MIVAKLHKSGKELMLAACDEELVGKTLNASNGAEIFLNPSFYGSEHCTKEELLKLIEESTIANLFGKETISAAGEHCAKIIVFDNVPHSQIVRLL